jgi:hypothetical protein
MPGAWYGEARGTAYPMLDNSSLTGNNVFTLVVVEATAKIADADPMTTTVAKPTIKLADEVWLATAMLHQRHPERRDFQIEEIVEFAKSAQELRLTGPLRPGFYVHVVQHCVANRPPNPGRYRMLFETGPGRRRLFRHGDAYHPQREGGKISPKLQDLPENWFGGLLAWYRDWCATAVGRAVDDDPLLALRGSGKALWADEHADDYVRRLREGWE